MLSILVVAAAGEDFTRLSGRHPSVEIIHAHDPEEAVEKLARNRRIDAVLLLCGAENARIFEAIREENPAPPPVFVSGSQETVPPGTMALPAVNPEELLDGLVMELEAGRRETGDGRRNGS